MDTLRVVHEVARALTSNLELNDVLRAIIGKMQEFFGPEGWSLLLVNKEKGELYFALTASDTSGSEKRRIKLTDGIAGYVASTGLPLVIPDITKNPEWASFAQKHPELHLHSIACLPIRHGGNTLGVLQLHNAQLDQLQDFSIAF